MTPRLPDTVEHVSREELAASLEALIAEIVGKMPQEHRKVLVSFERGKPDWSTLSVPAAPDLPAVKWRQQNLDKLAPERREALVTRLAEVLGIAR